MIYLNEDNKLQMEKDFLLEKIKIKYAFEQIGKNQFLFELLFDKLF